MGRVLYTVNTRSESDGDGDGDGDDNDDGDSDGDGLLAAIVGEEEKRWLRRAIALRIVAFASGAHHVYHVARHIRQAARLLRFHSFTPTATSQVRAISLSLPPSLPSPFLFLSFSFYLSPVSRH